MAWLGVGPKLMDYIIEIAKDLKLESIYSCVSRANYKMINLSCKMGFEAEPVDEFTVNMQLNLTLNQKIVNKRDESIL